MSSELHSTPTSSTMSFSEEEQESCNLSEDVKLTVFFLGGVLGLVDGFGVDVVLP